MFSLAIFEPLPGGGHSAPATTIDLSPDITSCKWSTSLPGGFNDLEVGMRPTGGPGLSFSGLTRPVDIKPFAHVELWYGAFLCFEGRVMRVRRPAGEVRGFSAVGYGMSALTDDFYQSRNAVKRKTSGFVASEVISSRVPLLNIGANYLDPAILHTRSEYDAFTPADIINAFVSEGGTGGDAWDYWVYENRTINFVPRIVPDAPTYAIPFDDRVEWTEDYTKLYGEVAVSFTDNKTSQKTVTPRQTSSAFATTYGLQRATVIEGGSMYADNAIFFAQTYLANQSIPAYAVQITRERLRGLEVPGGVDAPPWTTRAAQWVQVGQEVPLIIIHSEYDATAQTLVVEAGQPVPHGMNQFNRLLRVAGHSIRGTNPITGARA